MGAELTPDGEVVLAMTRAEALALREAVSFADFAGDLPRRDPAEVRVVSALLASLDLLISELGTDAYNAAVDAAWRSIHSSK